MPENYARCLASEQVARIIRAVIFFSPLELAIVGNT